MITNLVKYFRLGIYFHCLGHESIGSSLSFCSKASFCIIHKNGTFQSAHRQFGVGLPDMLFIYFYSVLESLGIVELTINAGLFTSF